MSAADRMAVRMPGGEIRSVPRRVGLAMVARSQATHAPAQSAPNPTAKGRRPASAVTVVTAEAPELYPPDMFEGTARADADVDVSDKIDLTQIAVLPDSGEIDLTPTAAPIEATVSSVIDREVFVERPKGNAGRDAWAEYARAHGVKVTDEMGRNDIRDLVAELETDRMSRPALQGGRPATPEDEPVTEDMVTSADPGERTA
jgi:hypothetical protein